MKYCKIKRNTARRPVLILDSQQSLDKPKLPLRLFLKVCKVIPYNDSISVPSS